MEVRQALHPMITDPVSGYYEVDRGFILIRNCTKIFKCLFLIFIFYRNWRVVYFWLSLLCTMYTVQCTVYILFIYKRDLAWFI